MAVFAMEAASIISERSLEISFASALSTVSASGLNVNAGERCCCPSALVADSCRRPLPCICSPLRCVTAAADLYFASAALTSVFALVLARLTAGGPLQQVTEYCQQDAFVTSGLNPDMGEWMWAHCVTAYAEHSNKIVLHLPLVVCLRCMGLY